nr:MAG TPA: hypothetical protein [Caudoviricetes sp.]
MILQLNECKTYKIIYFLLQFIFYLLQIQIKFIHLQHMIMPLAYVCPPS